MASLRQSLSPLRTAVRGARIWWLALAVMPILLAACQSNGGAPGY